MNRGIDYGNGITNIDRETGIRFGVIPVNDVLQAWCDDSEAVYPDPEPIDCETCGATGTIPVDASAPDGDTEECSDCDGSGYCENADGCDDFAEPIGFTYSRDGYECECGSDSGDIFVLKSPYFTRAQFCSPCAPGAVYLTNPTPDGERGYCFGHDWFEDGRAPYPVYRVDTGAEVFPEPA